MAFRTKRNSMLHQVLKDPAREVAINEEIAKGAQWIIEGPLRRVPPYYFTYLTFCKQRWIGQQLLSVFTQEFRDRTQEYYKRAIDNGLVLVNDEVASTDQVLKNGDLIMHRTHKHEQPVTSRPIKIVHQDDDLVVIDKPGGLPVHPTGRFNFNTVMALLEHENKIVCHPCNRLDRLTSGLMFLAKNSKSAEKLGQQIRDRTVSKQYLALVIGKFPPTAEVEGNMRTVDPKLSLNMMDNHPDSKTSCTKFKFVSYDKETDRSLVLCMPETGRTHQIRVHLQHLGFPIVNDPIYSNPEVWGPTLGKNFTAETADVEKIAAALDKAGKTEPAQSYEYPNAKGEMLSGEVCDICDTPLYTDPGPNDLNLYLHALRYKAQDNSWSYDTDIPEWATNVHMKFMRKALEEARKAPDLPGAFAVGAVLVHDGEILETGYTRELEGNTHAEENALAKLAKRGQEIPEGTCLYTTMEPCTYRLSGNKPCNERVLENPAIKTVFVGVMEPSTFVQNNTSRSTLEREGVIYIKIPGVSEEALQIAEKGHRVGTKRKIDSQSEPTS